MNPTSIGKYQLLSQLGQRGLAEVWLAKDPDLGREVTIMIPRRDTPLSPEMVRVSKHEAQKLAGLAGIRGIVTVYEAGERDGQFYIVSEVVQGKSLASRIEDQTLSLNDAVELVARIAEILHQAHLEGIVHRNVKPDNIVLDEGNQPILIDFGLAITEEEHLESTLPYMSPEQITGDARVANSRVDIYALGVLLYRLLTGQLPFVAASVKDFEELITNGFPRPPRTIDDTIPLRIETICRKCLAKKPDARYATADELAKELRGWNVPSQRTSTRAVVAMVAVMLLVFLGLCSAVYWSGNKVVPPTPTTSDPRQRVDEKIPVSLEDAKKLFRVASDSAAVGELKGNSFRIESRHPVGFQLYDINNAFSYRVRLRIRLDAHDHLRSTSFGIILGYRTKGVDRNQYNFQSIELTRRKKTSIFLRTVASGLVGTPPTSTRTIAREDISNVEQGEHTLEAQIGQNGLEVVSWDNKSLAYLSAPDANEHTTAKDYTGAIGVLITNGRVEVLSCDVVISQNDE